MCCNQENGIDFKIEAIPCRFHTVVGDREGGVPSSTLSIAPLTYGTDPKKTGSLRLDGTPLMEPSYLSLITKKVKDGSSNHLYLYLGRSVSNVQRKLGGVTDKVMATLSAIWGGPGKIPADALNACKGLPEDEALTVALKRGTAHPTIKVDKAPPEKKTERDLIIELQKKVSNLSVKAPGGPPVKAKVTGKTDAPPKGKKKDTLEYKNQDPSQLQLVKSAFGTKFFREIISRMNAELGAGKFPIEKVAPFFHGGKLKPGKKSEALKLRIN